MAPPGVRRLPMSDVPLPPPPTAPAGSPPTELTVDLTFGDRQRRTFAFVIAVLGGLGLVCLVSAVGADPPGRYGLLAFAAVWFSATYGLIRLRRRIFAPRSLVFDRRGIRHVTSDRRAFQVEWSELSQARVSYARKPGPLRNPLSWGGVTADAPVGESPPPQFGVSTFVRLDLVPSDPGFLDRHDLTAFTRWTGRPDGVDVDPTPWAEDIGDRQAIIRIPFGDLPELLAATDAALRTFAGDRYHPAVNEGLAWGFTYS